MHKAEDRVLEVATVLGLNDVTVGGAVAGYTGFGANFANGDTFEYSLFAVDGNGIPTGQWETGIGAWNSTLGQISRAYVYRGSSGNLVKVNFSGGLKRITVSATSWLYRRLGGIVSPETAATYLPNANVLVNAKFDEAQGDFLFTAAAQALRLYFTVTGDIASITAQASTGTPEIGEPIIWAASYVVPLTTKRLFSEKLQVTATNTIAPLTKNCFTPENARLVANTSQFVSTALDATFGGFTLSGTGNKTVTWNPGITGISLDPATTPFVYMQYETTE